MENKPTIKEHYIPKMILKHFSKDGRNVWKYDKSDKTSKFVPYEKECYINSLYEFEGNYKGKEVNVIEKGLMKIECKMADIIQKKIVNEKPITENDKAIILLFTLLQFLRVPRNLDLIKQVNIEILKNSNLNMNGDEIDRFSKISALYPIFLSTKDKKINANFEWAMKLIEGKDLIIYKSTLPFVLNGSSPVNIIPNKNMVFFPITPNRCIAYIPLVKSLYKDVPNKFVNRLNILSYCMSDEFIYFYDKI